MKTEPDAETMRQVSVAVAQQEAMAGPVQHLSHGTRLFRVASGWQSRAIAADPGVSVCRDLRSLDAAMQDENRPVIFIPFDAMMTGGDIEKVSKRHGVIKTLFWEERDA